MSGRNHQGIEYKEKKDKKKTLKCREEEESLVSTEWSV